MKYLKMEFPYKAQSYILSYLSAGIEFLSCALGFVQASVKLVLFPIVPAKCNQPNQRNVVFLVLKIY